MRWAQFPGPQDPGLAAGYSSCPGSLGEAVTLQQPMAESRRPADPTSLQWPSGLRRRRGTRGSPTVARPRRSLGPRTRRIFAMNPEDDGTVSRKWLLSRLRANARGPRVPDAFDHSGFARQRLTRHGRRTPQSGALRCPALSDGLTTQSTQICTSTTDPRLSVEPSHQADLAHPVPAPPSPSVTWARVAPCAYRSRQGKHPGAKVSTAEATTGQACQRTQPGHRQ